MTIPSAAPTASVVTNPSNNIAQGTTTPRRFSEAGATGAVDITTATFPRSGMDRRASKSRPLLSVIPEMEGIEARGVLGRDSTGARPMGSTSGTDASGARIEGFDGGVGGEGAASEGAAGADVFCVLG